MFISESFHQGIEPFLLAQFAHKTAVFTLFDLNWTRLYLIGITGTLFYLSFVIFLTYRRTPWGL